MVKKPLPLLVMLVALAFSTSSFAQVIPAQHRIAHSVVISRVPAYHTYGYPRARAYVVTPRVYAYAPVPYYAYPPYPYPYYSYAPYGYYPYAYSPYGYYPYYARPGFSFSFGVGGPFFAGGSFVGHGHGSRGHGHGHHR